LISSNFIEPVKRFFEKRRMRAELKRLRASGELDRILRESDYTTTGPAQGEWCEVYRKGTEGDRSATLFASPLADEAYWWIVQRQREETGQGGA